MEEHVMIQPELRIDRKLPLPEKPQTRETTGSVRYYDADNKMWIICKTQEKLDRWIEKHKKAEKMSWESLKDTRHGYDRIRRMEGK